jgi:nucleoside-diphosphate-sugar epimerase
VKLLVIGGAGTIGKILVPGLAAAGHEVDVFDKAINQADNMFTFERLLHRMNGKDAVVHLAAIPHPHIKPEDVYRKMNWAAAVDVLEAVRMVGIKRFVFASSGCAFGFWGGRFVPPEFPITEDMASLDIENGQCLYGYYKHLFEQYMESKARGGVRWSALRIEGGFGPTHISRKNETWFSGEGGEPSGPLAHYFAAASPDNLVQMFNLALTVDFGTPFEVFNCGDATLDDSVDGDVLHRTHWPKIPDRRANPKRDAFYGIGKAVRMLGYRPSR